MIGFANKSILIPSVGNLPWPFLRGGDVIKPLIRTLAAVCLKIMAGGKIGKRDTLRTYHRRQNMRRTVFFSIFAIFLMFMTVASAHAQLVNEYNPPQATTCCLATAARNVSDQLLDWSQLARYHAANEELKKQPADPKRVVFLGDSITDNWRLQEYFPGKPYVNRGIGGQTTPQLLVRTYPDVIELKPAAVIILAGTNDIAQNTGPETPAMIEENLMAITELAQKHGIKVILCAITPISDYTTIPPRRGAPVAPNTPPQKRRQSVNRPPADILKLNAWMKGYAASVGAIYADYYAAVVDGNGMFKEGFSDDGLHPNDKGFALLTPVAQAAIEKALQ
jgi:lysophospholipase L1-like esterase